MPSFRRVHPTRTAGRQRQACQDAPQHAALCLALRTALDRRFVGGIHTCAAGRGNVLPRQRHDSRTGRSAGLRRTRRGRGSTPLDASAHQPRVDGARAGRPGRAQPRLGARLLDAGIGRGVLDLGLATRKRARLRRRGGHSGRPDLGAEHVGAQARPVTRRGIRADTQAHVRHRADHVTRRDARTIGRAHSVRKDARAGPPAHARRASPRGGDCVRTVGCLRRPGIGDGTCGRHRRARSPRSPRWGRNAGARARAIYVLVVAHDRGRHRQERPRPRQARRRGTCRDRRRSDGRHVWHDMQHVAALLRGRGPAVRTHERRSRDGRISCPSTVIPARYASSEATVGRNRARGASERFGTGRRGAWREVPARGP